MSYAYTKTGKGINLQAENAAAVSASDAVTFEPGTLYVGIGGTVSVTTYGGTTALIRNVPSGTIIPVLATKVNLTNTTATGFVIFY